MNTESCKMLPSILILAGYSWSSFLYSIRSDLAELKSSVSEGANELMTMVREAIPDSTLTNSGETTKEEQQEDDEQVTINKTVEGHPQTKEMTKNEESLSSRFSGFLSSTISKTKKVIHDVLEETSADNNDM